MNESIARAVETGQSIPRGHSNVTSIFIAARPDLFVEGVVRILEASGENRIVACVEPSDACWDKLRNSRPEVLLLHHTAVQEPVKGFIARIEETVPGIRVLIFGQNMEDTFLLGLIRAGISGYVNQNLSSQNLLAAIHEVKKGGLWVERRLLETLARSSIDMERTLENTILEHIDAVRRVLTRRETMVFQLVLEGYATKEIADKICLSEQSVKLHLGRIFKKFQVTNRSQLILSTFSRICPVSNVFRLIRSSLDRRRIESGQPPLIPDPLAGDVNRPRRSESR